MLTKLASLYFSVGRAILATWDWFLIALSKVIRWGFVALIPLLIAWYAIGHVNYYFQFNDADPDRGAAAIVNDLIDADVAKQDIRYLPQNWSEQDSLWFYNATQGSNLLPYTFFLHLEQPDKQALFRDSEHINKYRYLPQDATGSNPDGLPVGMAKDQYLGKEYMGFTCAACHTSQINYRDADNVAKGLRIDGGPSAADLEQFLSTMSVALRATIDQPAKRERFYDAVLAAGYDSREAIEADLAKYERRIRSYVEVNEPVWGEGDKSGVTHYGFSRLDAFGRIYNRVLQYVVSAEQIQFLLEKHLPARLWQSVEPEIMALADEKDQTNLALRSLAILDRHNEALPHQEFNQALSAIRSQLYNSANAPASYPYLWDITQHDFVQWTGLVSNGGIGPLGRNVGQVIGVFGTLDWQQKQGWSISSVLGGQGIERDHIEFKSSIDKRNLKRVEQQLRSLWSPQWPDAFQAIDHTQAALGQSLFEQRCASCHANIKRDDPERRVIANITKLEAIGTDSVLALNSTRYKGFGGLIEGEYVEAGGGEILIEQRQPVASLVKFSTKNVVTSWDPDKWLLPGMAEWLWDFVQTLNNNDIRATLRRGNYEPGTSVNPFKPIESYKARSLNGIWATAPYLHNGSVPNLYDLLLPKKRVGDPELDEQGSPMEYRPDTFLVGSREFDQTKVGFRSAGYTEQGFVFDTTLRGNANTGHEYAAGNTADNQGRKFAALNRTERLQLLEYLKTL